ncbi:hypothetical protein LF817_09535 [Halobacillus sp. A1]|uniref:hypothetical protein n=1 Tax=Halobacillus sp. A1 TaxID=2880262 RepID=UPI0020A683E3|nr:hypothetical protein [Halobacillus sp. A1]MCP3031591.1 hypothetical protein [Halobacillus sp. A1]
MKEIVMLAVIIIFFGVVYGLLDHYEGLTPYFLAGAGFLTLQSAVRDFRSGKRKVVSVLMLSIALFIMFIGLIEIF